MSQSVATKIIPRARMSKRMAKMAAAERSRAKELAEQAGAPEEIISIPTRSGESVQGASAFIRPMGNSRRVFLLDPHMSGREMHGLAHRVKVLANNEALNSVLIATDDRDDAAEGCLPSYIANLDTANLSPLPIDDDPVPGQTWHVSGGYDPLKLYESGDYKSAEKVDYLLSGVKNLANAVSGMDQATKVPVITAPHGAVSDGGYALCTGSFVLATRQSSFCIMNPSRGLGLDPVGFSYFLPRLGTEQKQQSQNYKACGMILALTGFQANAYDMVETGLATHLLSSTESLEHLEEALASMNSWSGQALLKKRKHYYGSSRFPDPNTPFRNIVVSQIINQVSEYDICPTNDLPMDDFNLNAEDAAFDVEDIPWESSFFNSNLVDYAATFDHIFKAERDLVGILARFHQIASKESNDEEIMEGIRVARSFVRSMEAASPLALHSVHRLMLMGTSNPTTLRQCMDREQRVQRKLMQGEDFRNWAEFTSKNPSATQPFKGWKHKSVADVTPDEVEELLRG